MEKVESKEKMRNMKRGATIELPISSLETIRNNVSLLNAKHLLVTARMYAQGYEKKEIANFKCRAVSTINNQLQKAFEILHVRNGRELATMLYERIAGVRLTMDFSPIVRVSVACCLLCIFSLSLYHEQGDMRRLRRFRIEHIERVRE